MAAVSARRIFFRLSCVSMLLITSLLLPHDAHSCSMVDYALKSDKLFHDTCEFVSLCLKIFILSD